MFGYLRGLKPAMRAVYSNYTLVDSSNKCHQWKKVFSFPQSENLFIEFYDSDENDYMCTKKEQTLSTWKQSRTSSLQETNDEGACLESFNFSCLVSKLNVYLITIAGISVSDLTDTFRRIRDPPRGRNTCSCWYFGGCGRGVAVEKVCGRHLKYSYNVCKISSVSQEKTVSKCNRIVSLVIFNYKMFMG